MFDLNKQTHQLLLDEPFFASISRRVNKTASKAIPTAGVRVTDDGYFEMLYNPEFFASIPPKERAGVLKHEFYHLLWDHCLERLPDNKMSKLWNIATDLAINSHLMNELPESGCFPGRGMFKDFPAGQSSEWYFEELKKMQEDEESDKGEGENQEGDSDESSSGQGDEGGSEPQSLNDVQTTDDHSGWGENEADASATNIAKERLKDIIKEAVQEASSGRGWGSVPSEMRKQIIEKTKTKIDWKKVLRYFVKTSQRANKRSTVKKLNKRYPMIHAGKRVRRQAHIAVSIDQSGSVSDDMLIKFFAELNKLSNIAEFTVIPFDDRVAEDKIYTWKKGQTRKWERVLHGGTCFEAPTEYVNKHGFDGHIILTDLCAPKPKKSKCQRMWMTDSYHASRPYFKTQEKVIAID
tara:strand:+ start:86 stop:1309 length:1224 start_codon:yes stop_codon:yes gene_type:complete